MMDSQKVYELAAKINAEKNVETNDSDTKANVEETKVETAEPKAVEAPKNEDETKNTESDVPKEEVKDEAKPDNSDDKEVENKNDNKPEKKQYSKQEQIDYSFKRLKAKNKKLEERIRQLEEENSKKFAYNFSLEDFKNNYEAYTNYLVDKKDAAREQSRLQDEYNQSRQEEFNYINAQRESNCFPDEQSRQQYYKIRQTYGPAFVRELDKEDPEQVVLGYLDDCDVAPLMMEVLMTNDNYKNEVLSKRSPYSKMRALELLENRIKYAQAELAKRKTTVPEKSEDTKPVESKKAMPVIGSVTKSESNSNGTVVRDYNAILRQLNNARLGSH